MSVAFPEPEPPQPTPASLRARSRRRSRNVLGASVAALPLTLTGTGVAQAATVVPLPSRPLPSTLDAMTYQGSSRCLTEALPGPVAFAKLLNATYGSHVYGVWRKCDLEHGEGRAMDWMLNAADPEGLELGNRITRWLSAPDAQGRPGAMARRFGIMYIIWNRQMWRAYDPGRGWTAYTGWSPHTDHIHFSFTWDGAYSRTSWWTGVAVTTPLAGPLAPVLTASGYPLLRRGANGPDVALGQRVVGASPDGDFGPLTAAALASWQRSQGLPVTSEFDNATWTRMVALRLVPARVGSGSGGTPTTKPPTTPTPPTAGSSTSPLTKYAGLTLRLWSRGEAVVALQKALGGLVADGSFGPLTQARVKDYQGKNRLPVTGEVTPAMWKVLIAAAKPTTPPKPPAPATQPPAAGTTLYTAVKSTTLALGAKGDPVKVLQRGLGGLAVDGNFGPLTRARLMAVQASLKLPATGVADARTWAALEARDYPLRAYWGTTLRRGSSGPAVVALQKALRIPADGHFGVQTEGAVKAAQRTARLTQTGVVALLTWQAIEKAMIR
ncbi:MAG: peptidoglycan-binding protein [Tetrasphaera sp.]|nr:peptidoglycan-binding protein [Tetrasphaera sp.]